MGVGLGRERCLCWGWGVGARFVGVEGVGDVECVLEISGWVLLRYEEGVEVPESGLDVAGLCLSRGEKGGRRGSINTGLLAFLRNPSRRISA